MLIDKNVQTYVKIKENSTDCSVTIDVKQK